MKKTPLSFLLLVGLVVAIIGGWSAFWFWSADKTEFLLDQSIIAQAQRGNDIACASRTRGGYPFRLEFTCEKPTVLLDRGQAPRHLTFERLVAVTQVWDPGHVIIHGTGPLVVRIGDRNAPENARVTWNAARGSAKLGLEGFNSSSFVAEDLALTQGIEMVRIKAVELHQRPSGETGRDLDIVSKVTGLAMAVPQLQGALFDLEVQLRAKQALRLPYMPVIHTLRDWQEAGGSLEIALLRIDQAETTARANGTLRLTREGRPDGTLEIRAAGLDQFVRRIGLTGNAVTAVQAAGFFGKPVDIDGKRGTIYQLNFANGAFSLGPLSFPLPGMF